MEGIHKEKLSQIRKQIEHCYAFWMWAPFTEDKVSPSLVLI